MRNRSGMVDIAVLSNRLRSQGYSKLPNGCWKNNDSGKLAEIRFNKFTRRFEVIYNSKIFFDDD